MNHKGTEHLLVLPQGERLYFTPGQINKKHYEMCTVTDKNFHNISPCHCCEEYARIAIDKLQKMEDDFELSKAKWKEAYHLYNLLKKQRDKARDFMYSCHMHNCPASRKLLDEHMVIHDRKMVLTANECVKILSDLKIVCVRELYTKCGETGGEGFRQHKTMDHAIEQLYYALSSTRRAFKIKKPRMV